MFRTPEIISTPGSWLDWADQAFPEEVVHHLESRSAYLDALFSTATHFEIMEYHAIVERLTNALRHPKPYLGR